MYYVYALRSLKDNNYYFGQTDNYKRRIGEHNSGKVISTKHRIPFELVGLKSFNSRNEARWFEYLIKHHSDKKYNFIRLLETRKNLKQVRSRSEASGSESLRLGGRGLIMAEKSLTGLPRKTAAALSYVLGPVLGVGFFLLEKDPFVKFHAMQSIVVFGILFLLQWAFVLTIFLAPLSGLLIIVMFVLWLMLIYKAWSGEEWEVPVLGNYTRKFLKKV